MIAVICGGTGLVGSLLVKKLINSPKISKVISIGRRSLALTDAKLHEVITDDLAKMQEHENQLKGDLYFCCLGTTMKEAGSKQKFKEVDFDLISQFGMIAKSHGAKIFAVISASGANSQSSIFYNKIKGKTEEFLRGLCLPNLIIYRPGLLIGHRKQFRVTEKVAVALGSLIGSILPKSVVRSVMTDADVLAKCMVEKTLMLACGSGSNSHSHPTSKNKVQIVEAKEIK